MLSEICILSLKYKLAKTLPKNGQGWVFATSKSIFARTVEKNVKNRQQMATSVVHKTG